MACFLAMKAVIRAREPEFISVYICDREYLRSMDWRVTGWHACAFAYTKGNCFKNAKGWPLFTWKAERWIRPTGGMTRRVSENSPTESRGKSSRSELSLSSWAIEVMEPDTKNADSAELLPLVYAELRRLASSRLAVGNDRGTLQPTALVHEAWIRLGGERRWRDRRHFFAAASEAMRHILIDRARRRQALRHGGGQERTEFNEEQIVVEADDTQLLQINDALERFAAVEPEKAELVKLRYFVGLSTEEAARALDISEPTAKRWWATARLWLFREIRAQ
jgi:RNA polymerase sigma factor (TIGR02999 family)